MSQNKNLQGNIYIDVITLENLNLSLVFLQYVFYDLFTNYCK